MNPNDKQQHTPAQYTPGRVEYGNNAVPTEDQKLTSPVVQQGNGRLRSYAEFVGDLFKCMDTHQQSCIHAAIGAAGEAGELADAIKKYWVYGKELDRANVIEELGDMRFYMQALQNLLGITDQEVILQNARKLEKRYPQGYTDDAANARADKENNLTLGVANAQMATVGFGFAKNGG